MKITIISKVPPDEAANAGLAAAVQVLKSAEHDVRMCVTGAPARARVLARESAEAGNELVVAAGGDGTVNEVVNGLMTSEVSAALGVLPLGTANDFAAGLGLPADSEQAARVLLGGTERRIDVARVNERYFVNMSTGGFGTDATRSANSEAKRVLGPIAYIVQGAMSLVHLESLQAKFVLDGSEVHAGELYFFAVGNLRQSGGGAQLAPCANFSDGELDLVIVPKLAKVDFMTLLPELRRGSHVDNPDVLYLRGKTLTVETEHEISVNADGEAVVGRSFVYSVHPRALRVRTQPLR